MDSEIETKLVRNDPGYPSDLKHVAKGSYARGEICLRSDPNLVSIGYDGLDVEVWCSINNWVFLIALKRMGYKALNTKYGHEVANLIRNGFLRIINENYEQLRKIVLENYLEPVSMSRLIYEEIYREKIVIVEKSIAREYSLDLPRSDLRVIVSSRIKRSEIGYEVMKIKIDGFRRETEEISKYSQLLAIAKYDSAADLDLYSMRSMILATKKDKLFKKKLARYIVKEEIADWRVYSDSFQSDRLKLINFLRMKIKNRRLVRILSEFYQRPILDITRYKKGEINLASLREIIFGDKGYMTNDFFILNQIDESIRLSEKFLIFHADREGMLRLNSLLGTELVDMGLLKQGKILNLCVAEISKKLKLNAYFCQRNVDEVIVLIRGKGIEEKYEKVTKVLKRSLMEVEKLAEFKVVRKGKVTFHSHLPGRFLYLDGSEFTNGREVLSFVDLLGQKVKKSGKFNMKFGSKPVLKHNTKKMMQRWLPEDDFYLSPKLIDLIKHLYVNYA